MHESLERRRQTPALDERSTRDRLAAQHDAECFYGVVPDHVWAALRHGDELGRDIAATEGLVRWRRQALRRAIAALRRLRCDTPALPASCDRHILAQRLVAGFAEAHRLYREAQGEHRALLDERWRRRLSPFRAAAE
jgi:hypothetical protein